MSEREFDLYLKLLSRCLSLTSQQRAQIADELRDHLEERLEELARAGIPREKAVFQALDEFGDAAVLAAHFSTIAHLKRRRFLMRLSLGSVAALAAALLVAFAFWPENRAVQGPPPLFAQNKSKTKVHSGAVPAKTPTAASVTTDHPLSSDAPVESPTEARISEALDQTIDFTIDPEPFKDAIDFISQRYQMPIIFDAKALDDAGINTNTQVRMPVTNIKLRQMLTLLLRQLPQPLGFDIQDGVLLISTVEKISEHRFVVVYDCRDLIHLRPMIPDTNAGRTTPPSPRLRGGGMFQVASTPAEKPKDSDRGGPSKASEKKAEPAKTSCAEPDSPLIRVIRYAGDADDWQEQEGEGPKITELGGLIVVKQNPIVHEQIKQILADLRRMRKAGAFAPLEKDHAGPSTTSAQGGTREGL